jgi:type III secretion system YscI/HrpB-like protein
MSYGIEAANSFLRAVQPSTLAEAPAARFNGLGQSLSVQNFEDQLRAAQVGAVPEIQLAQADPSTAVPGATATDVVPPLLSAPPVAETAPGAEVDSRLRAAEGLGLEAEPPVGPGNSILNGLEQLRATFDSQYNSVGSKLEGTTLDVTAMMQLQADMVQYSVLVDVSSKLAGKVTTSIDSLMKGQ